MYLALDGHPLGNTVQTTGPPAASLFILANAPRPECRSRQVSDAVENRHAGQAAHRRARDPIYLPDAQRMSADAKSDGRPDLPKPAQIKRVGRLASPTDFKSIRADR